MASPPPRTWTAKLTNGSSGPTLNSKVNPSPAYRPQVGSDQSTPGRWAEIRDRTSSPVPSGGGS
jgi:hypothetical protein